MKYKHNVLLLDLMEPANLIEGNVFLGLHRARLVHWLALAEIIIKIVH